LGLDSGNKVITVYNNTSSGTLFIETIGFTCTTGSASDWGIASGTVPFQLGQTQMLTHYSIFFQPHTATTYNCDFVLTMLDGYVLDVPLTGTGLTSTASSTLNKMSLSFPNQTIGTASTTQPVTITNNGTSALTLNSISIAPTDFAYTNNITFPVTINSNSSYTVNVNYQPAYVRNESGAINFVYEQVPVNGVTLSGNGVAATSLDISTNPTLPQATQGYAYQTQLATSGGTGPYTWALAAGSSLPPGLSISTSGEITGTVSSSASTTTPYTFTIQATDTSNNKVASSLMNITVFAYLGDGNGESCNDLSWNDPVLGTPMVAITDLGTGEFEGQYEGGLYPNGNNNRPSSQDSYGVTLADSIQPLDSSGNPSPTGKYVMLAVGESTAQNEFNRFLPIANGDPAKNQNLVLVNGAQGGATPNTLTSTTSTYWVTVLENYLPQNNVTANQVVAIWMEDTDGIASGTFPSDITDLQSEYETMMQTMLTLFPNLKLVYFSSRVYGGYSNGTATPDNPEPYAYEVGYAVKWAIGDQINGNSNLCDGNGCSPTVAPWMSWGTYYWSNGMLGRQDGLEWDCEDFSADGTHPSSTYGQLKVATALLQFLKNDDTTVPWYLTPNLTLAPTGGNNQSGPVGTTLPTQLTVTAENLNSGVPQSGVSVTFKDNGAGGTFNPTSATTGSNGQASTTYTLPSTAQTVSITASANNYASATFTETATVSNTLTATAGNNQSGPGGVALPVALQVTATSGGTNESGVAVTFTDNNAGGTFNPTSGTTGSNGTLSTIYTPPVVTQTTAITITATATGYTSATFSETATPSVQTLTATSGNNQTGTVGSPLTAPLVVTATSNGTPVSGVTVSFTDGNGGLFSPASGTTGSNGQISTTYTPEVSGTLTVTASATGYTSATFTETVTAGTQVLSVAGGNNQTGTVGTKLAKSLEVKATINGVPASGVTITFNQGSANGVFGNPVGTTGSAGTIFTTYTLPSTPQTVTITASATGYTSAVFTETATAAAEVLTPTAGNNQTGTGGVQLPVALQVTATDNGTDESGVSVNFTDNDAGGTFGTPSGTTGSTGTLSTTYTPAVVTKTTTVTITASATGYTSATFTETVNPAPVQTLTATSGGGQTGTVGVAFPTALVVTATSNGTAQSGVTVSFTDGQGGTFNPASGTTGSNGQISTIYTPEKSGTLTVTASATGYTSATFTETANAPVQTLTATSGSGQTGTVGSPLAAPLVVTATSNSVPVSGVTVSFTDGNGGLFSPASGTTGSNGQISTTYTPEVAGTLTVTASATGYTSAIFTETVNAAAGKVLAVTAGNNQTGGVGTKLPVLLEITATSNGAPVKGVKVTFTDNGGTLSPTQATTNASGEASTSYTLPGTAGTYTVTASASGYTSAIFTETAEVETVSTISLVSGGKQKGTVGTTLANPIVWEAKSSSGQPVSGALITFSSGTAGGTFNPSSATTGANGEASTEYTLPDKPEVITVTASDGSVSAVTTEQSLAGPPADLTIVTGNNQSCTEGNPLPKGLVVLVTDQFDNGLGGVSVTFVDNGAGGTFSGNGTATTSSNGQASITYTCGTKAEKITIDATTSTLGPLAFTETVAK
jgi:hypothetical protein